MTNKLCAISLTVAVMCFMPSLAYAIPTCPFSDCDTGAGDVCTSDTYTVQCVLDPAGGTGGATLQVILWSASGKNYMWVSGQDSAGTAYCCNHLEYAAGGAADLLVDGGPGGDTIDASSVLGGANVDGLGGDDVITGTDAFDDILGGDGHDTIWGEREMISSGVAPVLTPSMVALGSMPSTPRISDRPTARPIRTTCTAA